MISTKASSGKKRLLVGITGGIGAGKSLLSRYFSKAGYPVLSADEIAREITQPGSAAIEEIRSAFGEDAILPDGSIHRAFIRSEITKDPSLRAKLDGITHPKIQTLSKQRADEFFQNGSSIVFYEAPLLFEAKSDRNMDKVICVHAPDSVRIQRVIARDKVSKADAEKLLRSQMPQDEKMKKSDFLVENSASEAQLEKNAEAVLQELLKLLR